MAGPAGNATGRCPSETAHAGGCVRRIDREEAERLARSRQLQHSVLTHCPGTQAVKQGEEIKREMKEYLAIIVMDIKLALRLRAVIFFNYLFPLFFFFGFATFLGRSDRIGGMVYVVNLSITFGVLGSGFFGAGIRAIQERELNILRRYKVTPITAAPLLVGSMVTGWIMFIPSIVLLLVLAHLLYKMPMPAHMMEFFVFVSLALIAFRALGLVIAAVANNM